MNKINYQVVMENMLGQMQKEDKAVKLLLHSCCGPCSTFCIQSLSSYFPLTVYYYNPNIYPEEEYALRAREQERFIGEFPTKHPVNFVEGPFDPEHFYAITKGLERVKEGGERCFLCYEMRLRETARYAKEHGYTHFTTTLSISPLKNAQKLNEIGERLGKEYGIEYLFSDFKKKDGYKTSTRLSAEYGMYRQYYCGCVFSKQARDKEIAEKNQIQE